MSIDDPRGGGVSPMAHIAYVCQDGGIPIDGTKGSSVHVRSMVKALAEANARITLLSPRLGDGSWAAGLRVDLAALPKSPATVKSNVSPPRDARIERTLDSLHKIRPFDAVYERLSLWADGASLWCRRRGVRHWIEVNAPLADEAAEYRGLKNADAAREVEAQILRRADLLFPVSPWLERWLRELGCDERKIKLLPNGVPSSWLKANAPPYQPPPRDARLTVGFVGSLRPWHGLEELIEAVSLLPADRYKLLIVGDGPMRDWLKEQLGGPLAGGIAWMGSVPSDDVPSMIDTMDCCVAPYRALDPFYFCPLKISEYGARRRPVVAPGLDDLRGQFPEDSMTYYKPGRAEDLAQAIETLFQTPRCTRSAVDKLHAHASSHTWDRHAAQILAWGGLELGSVEVEVTA